MSSEQNCLNVNTTASVEECRNTNSGIVVTPAGERIVRVPVTLAEIEVRTSLSANITFPDPVLEIKDIKKRVKIVQCNLMLPGIPATSNPFTPGNRQLFLKGYVRKNIQYATPCLSACSQCVSSEIKSLTLDVPFECVTTILAEQFITQPQLPLLNARSEYDFFRAQNLGLGYPEKDQLLSSDLSQFHQVSTQYYNPFPFCEIISSNITEYDEAIDRQVLSGQAPFEEGAFQNIVEKMFLQFQIKVLQNQQVRLEAL